LTSLSVERRNILEDLKQRCGNPKSRCTQRPSLTGYCCSLSSVTRYAVDQQFPLAMLAPLQRSLHQFPHRKFRRRQPLQSHEELQTDVWYIRLRCRPSHCLETWRDRQGPLAVVLATPVCTVAMTVALATTRPQRQRWTTLMMTAPGNYFILCGVSESAMSAGPSGSNSTLAARAIWVKVGE